MSTPTLTLDDDLLAQAEAYTRRTGTDLSVLVAQALQPLVQPLVQSGPTAEALPAALAALYGCISLPPGFDYKEHLADAILDRRPA